MERNKLYDIIIQRKQKLNELKPLLAKEFVGLDSVIEEVLGLIAPWYLFPEAQLRPTIINMWGLTGSGKTALVNRIVELLDQKRLYVHFDMGEFDSASASWIKTIFTDELEFFHEQPGIICLDEFQFARTVSRTGTEIEKDKLRVIWEILDSGKINYIPYHSSYYMQRAELCLVKLMKCEDKGVVINNGTVEFKEEDFIEVFSEFYFESDSRAGVAVDKNYFLSQDFTDGLFYLCNDPDLTRKLIKERLKNASLPDIQQMLMQAIRSKHAVKQLDLSKSLIFVLGNLDEAYYMSHNLNPDISADGLHALTCKINISHIKSALKERFRNEQIARLGNNHVIYRSFTNKNFRDIISQKLEALSKYAEQRFGFSMCFDETVIDVIYAEGVYPAQGTRPVFTTINNLVGGNISKVVLEIISKNLPVSSVDWNYVDEKFVFTFMDSGRNILNVYEEKLTLKMNALRRIENIQVQAHTAVHEAGHAILAALTLRIIPSLVVSKTASAHSEGFCVVNMPQGIYTREILMKDIMIGLGGYVAEKIVFGENQTSSGVSGDIEKVTETASRAIKEYAMGQDPFYIRFVSSREELAMAHSSIHTYEAMKLIRACEIEATAILEKNKLLLLKMAQHLTANSRMEEAEIFTMVCNYSAEPWVSKEAFVKKDNYFRFSSEIEQQLALQRVTQSAKS